MTIQELRKLVAKAHPVGIYKNPIAFSGLGGYGNAGTFSSGSNMNATFSLSRTPSFNCSFPVMWFGNFIGDNIGPNAITVSASINNVSATFNGSLTVTLQPGQIVASDPFPNKYLAGTIYQIKTYALVATSGMKWPLGLTTKGGLAANANEGAVFDVGDYTTSGSIPQNTNTAYHPFAITATPLDVRAYPTVVIAGDSVACGFGDTADLGYPVRGLKAIGVPHHRFAYPGTNPSAYGYGSLASAKGYQAVAVTGAGEIILDCFGANDMLYFGSALNYTSFSQVEAYYTGLWTWFNQLGFRVFKPSILPDSRNNATMNSWRTTLNDNLRAGKYSSIVERYIETADIAETARNSNTWKTGLSDGTHPNTTGAPLLGAALTADMFYF